MTHLSEPVGGQRFVQRLVFFSSHVASDVATISELHHGEDATVHLPAVVHCDDVVVFHLLQCLKFSGPELGLDHLVDLVEAHDLDRHWSVAVLNVGGFPHLTKSARV